VGEHEKLSTISDYGYYSEPEPQMNHTTASAPLPQKWCDSFGSDLTTLVLKVAHCCGYHGCHEVARVLPVNPTISLQNVAHFLPNPGFKPPIKAIIKSRPIEQAHLDIQVLCCTVKKSPQVIQY
jgi:hypothetical protein